MSDSAHTLTDAERVRIGEIDELVLRGPDGVAALVAALSERSWTVRRAAVTGLASLGGDAAPALCAWLLNERTSEHAIAAAVDALSMSVGDAATGEVIALAGRGTGAVLEDVARILGRRRAYDGVPLLRDFLASENDNIAMAAIEALGAIGGTASIDALITVIEGGNFFRTFPAMQVAARSGDPRVIGPLAALLADEMYRFDAAHALGQTGSILAIAHLYALLGADGDDRARLVVAALDDLWTRAAWSGSSDLVLAAIRDRFSADAARFIPLVTTGDITDRRAAVRIIGAIGGTSAMAALAPLLDDPELRVTATEAIQHLARTDDANLLEALASEDPQTRAAVLPVVSSSRSAAAVRRRLTDDNAEVRARACEALARIGDTTAVKALFRALDDNSPRVAHAAAAAIHSLGTSETPALAIAALQSPRPNVRRQALRVIGYLGTAAAFDAVCAALSDPDPRTSEIAVGALAALDDPRVDDVLRGLTRSPTAALRAATMRAVGHRGGAQALTIIDEGLADDDAWVRYYACQALGAMGLPSAMPKLVARVSDASAQVRVAAIEALARLDSPATWQQLMSLARSRDPDEQRAALVGISQHTEPAAVVLLLDAAKSPDLATRLIALSGLARSHDPAALASLAEAAADESVELRDAALSLLGEREDAAAAMILVELALRSELEHPSHATLSRPGASRIAAIRTRLDTAQQREVTLLVAALARMQSPDATAALFTALQAPNPDVRRDAVTALVAIGAPGSVEAARRMAAEDADQEVRRASTAALGS